MLRAATVRALVYLMTALSAVICLSSPVRAGTTGALSGHVVDSLTQAPIAGAKVSAVSPSQSETATTDPAGAYAFASLAPDSYAVTVTKEGYDTSTQPGITVLADQTQTLTVVLKKSAAVLATVNVAGTQSALVKGGVTSNVYSISGAAGQAATALGGSANLNNAYSQMASVPGVSSVQGQQGWYQPIYIRGGDLDQVGWEFDGIPVNRTYDNAPQTFLSNLGQQELQVYTGGTSANADASGIAGYVNQVIRRGTNPPYQTLDLGMGGPSQYNKLSIEAGGATPNNSFSYYLGSSVVDQGYRYIDQFNGASFINQGYFYPINTKYFGAVANEFTPGNAYGIADTKDHENVANLHFRVGASDDIQLLYTTSYLYNDYYSSQNDLGGRAFLTQDGAAINFADQDIYAGQLFTAPNPAAVVPYLFASTPHAFGALIPPNIRDSNTNSDSISKLQYQHNFSSSAYLRVFGFSDYSNWYIHGPESQALFCCYGAELADYELPSHQYGAVADYSNQINDRNLITLSALYESTHILRETTTGGFPGADPGLTSDVSGLGTCVDAADQPIDCIPSNAPSYRGPGASMGSCPNTSPSQCQLTIPLMAGQPVLEPWPAPAGSQWLVTESGYRQNYNKVNPVFYALGLNDNYKPSDRLTFNIGLRVEEYVNNLDDSTSNPALYPARAFWFAAYNNEFCFAPGYFQPLEKALPGDTCASDYPLTTAVNEVNSNPSSFSHTEFQPRFGTSYQAGPNDVFRLSAGIYSRPASTREASWNVTEQDLAAFLGVNFAQYGQFTPNHDVRPDRSTNLDFSWEHRFAGSDASMRITPFYRSTQDQVQQTVVNALSGLFASFNTGHLESDGVEFAVQSGSFSKDGFAASLAYTYTHSQIRFNDFPNGRNVIDLMNQYIQLYNSYTGSCTGVAPSPNKRSMCGVFGDNSASSPYATDAAKPLLDDNAWYAPYDLIPVPFDAGNGYEVPDTATLVVNYKHAAWNVTPSLTYSAGSVYGSPLSWEDASIFPAVLAGNPLMIPDPYTGNFDNFGAFKQPSRLTANLGFGYQFTPNTRATLQISNLYDHCTQRGYAWDYSEICSYSNLPSSILTPSGGTLANAAAGPVQLKYPYAMWLNNDNTGFVGVKMPIEAALEVSIKT